MFLIVLLVIIFNYLFRKFFVIITEHYKKFQQPLIIGGLLKYENKKSVLHFNIIKHYSYKEPIQSKVTLFY